MRWLVTGAGGLLGHDLLRRLLEEGEPAVGLPRTELDVTDAAAVRAAVRDLRPDVIVNCAAFTAVDDAEHDPARALRVNRDGPGNLAAACADTSTRLLHISTDYVFAGGATRPYPVDAGPAPRTVYGRTKLAGERAVLSLLPHTGHVVRTAWLYGAVGRNFVRTMIRLERERETVEVVTDQRGQPTWSLDLAEWLLWLGRGTLDGAIRPGVHHATADGETTWYELARETFRLLGADPDRVRPTTSDILRRAAVRPSYSVLAPRGSDKAAPGPMRHWRTALAEAVPKLVEAELNAAGQPTCSLAAARRSA
ncbi:dTDP-4-dehydrorhamnose reductase [Streptomyces sp. RPT161]|uniref:dTDP-4-dehydrorhamnose reductase n=1 Tax=Streptomyces sp. RPT161 TaxID=3015993 RepID=UPI0022B93BFA|nr:dTDP-4-dehydrorhamnose reductase [Streptomyces sp. RPT161]